jgi:hypothetical protein
MSDETYGSHMGVSMSEGLRGARQIPVMAAWPTSSVTEATRVEYISLDRRSEGELGILKDGTPIGASLKCLD